jgi:hypothetical protein
MGSLYSDGPDQPKTIVSNDWDEDLVIKIKSQVIRCMNLFSAESRSIDF